MKIRFPRHHVFLAAVFLIAIFAISIDGAASEANAKDDATLFYLSFDQSLEADIAAGDIYPKSGTPKITDNDGGVSGEAVDLTAFEAKDSPNYVTLTYPAIENLHLEAGTVEFWYQPKFPNLPSGDTPLVTYFLFDLPTSLTDENNQTVRVGLTINEDSLGRKIGLLSGVTGTTDPTTAFARVLWESDEWHHIAITWDADEILLFLDGIPVASLYSQGGLFGGNGETISSMIGVFGIGGAYGHSVKISAGGLIDDFWISNKALNEDELHLERRD